VANVRVHGTTGEPPFARLPREGLAALAGKPDYDTSLVSYRWSSADCLVSYEGNYYSLPAAAARQRVLVRETEHDELLILSAEGAELARHRLVAGYRERAIVPAHYDDLAALRTPRPGQRRGALQVPQPPAADPLLPDAPAVEVRSLRDYDRVTEVAR
jgi:hypothetical protein